MSDKKRHWIPNPTGNPDFGKVIGFKPIGDKPMNARFSFALDETMKEKLIELGGATFIRNVLRWAVSNPDQFVE